MYGFKDIPKSLGKLVCLSYLTLDGGSMPTLPDTLGLLCRLGKLVVENCSYLSSLPGPVSNLKLTVLVVTNCPLLSSLPPVYNLALLTDLRVTYTQIKSLPEGFEMLKNLQTLELSGNQHLTCIPACVPTLDSLTKIILDDCASLSAMPDNIGLLARPFHRTDCSIQLFGCSSLCCFPYSMGAFFDNPSLLHGVDGAGENLILDLYQKMYEWETRFWTPNDHIRYIFTNYKSISIS